LVSKHQARTARTIRSFVRRGGRLTSAQERALVELWPKWGIDFSDKPLDFSAIYNRQAPCVLEIGFGNGETLANDAEREPDKNFLGVEVHQPGVGRLLMELQRREIDNIRIICHDVVEVLRQITPASLDAVNIYFPDPWPKKRHHKRRLIQMQFLARLATTMAPGGRLHIATDWGPYAEHIHACLEASPAFEPAPDSNTALRGETRFERRGKKLGHDVWDFVYKRLLVE